MRECVRSFFRWLGYQRHIPNGAWLEHDITAGTNDKGEQEVLDIIVAPLCPPEALPSNSAYPARRWFHD